MVIFDKNLYCKTNPYSYFISGVPEPWSKIINRHTFKFSRMIQEHLANNGQILKIN